ncbi:CPBP family intramembrane glutamic endopeptidase [Geojedonia litorea]|uniref:CPBP family intramembrane glutamic endopeptidase n=1 Tax=Geojedonia litorea TaxID=1268269 RepID=A0ABV9N1D5_9FLAO
MNQASQNKYNPIGIFLSITFALSAIFYALIIYSGKVGGGAGYYAMGLMWCPGIAALITMKMLKRKVADLGWAWGKTRYQLKSYLIPFLYALIAYLIVWSFGFGAFYNEATVTWIKSSFGLGDHGDGIAMLLYVLLVGTFGVISSMSSALGEEIGWRGILVPELYKSQGFTKTSLITGVIWGVWHLPVLLFADYNSGTPAWYGMLCFMLLVVSISFVYTWFRMKSGSLWTAVILHGSHNLFVQSIFTPLTKDTGNTAYYIDEFGIVLPIVAVGFALYFWNKRKALDPVLQEA